MEEEGRGKGRGEMYHLAFASVLILEVLAQAASCWHLASVNEGGLFTENVLSIYLLEHIKLRVLSCLKQGQRCTAGRN